jgi:hypothetical protein
MGSSHTLDQLEICFDDTHAVANAGLLVAATLAERLGIQQAADQLIDLGERPGAAHPGRKLLTLVHSMLLVGLCQVVPAVVYGASRHLSSLAAQERSICSTAAEVGTNRACSCSRS